MKKFKWTLAAVVGALALAGAAWAFDAASLPPEKQTKANLYLASPEVTGFLAGKGGRTLFIDVRTPAELMFVGSTPLIDANVPLRLGPTLEFDDKKGTLVLEANPSFVSQVEHRLAAKSLSKGDAVILMCRSGERSAAAANLLTEAGFTQVYSVIDGFEGDPAKDGPSAGHRTVNGWKNKGLPWGYSLDKEKMTLSGSPH
jgi:rhodanese-related sulfurtransferase